MKNLIGIRKSLIKDFEGAKLFIVDELYTEHQLYHKAKQLIKAHGVKMVVIDYLMLMESNHKFKEKGKN